MIWVAREDGVPPKGTQVLVFSPVYEEEHPMRFRIVGSQFFGLVLDATHWAPLEAPKEKGA